ncbi:MAG: ABC transporter permease [Deltaproteobacteria bacterium]|nr:ABC transporter permease [Deltaproteobacteria bacterium]
MLIVILIFLTILFSIFLPGKVFSVGNFQSMAFQLPELSILAIAMMITMLSGGINLSIIATANTSGIITATILTKLITADSGNSFYISVIAILAGWTAAFLIGIVNGFIISHIGVSPVLATLGMMTVLQGLNILYTKGNVISGFPPEILFIGNGTILGIPFALIIFLIIAFIISILLDRTPLIIAFIISILLDRTPFGLSNYLIGSNETASYLSGINVKKVLIWTYAISGLLCGVASTVMISHFNSARAGYGASYLLITILAAVLGGTNPYGGLGKVSGLVIALFILQVASSGLNLLGVSTHFTKALWGIILIFVIGLRNIKFKNNIKN